MRLAEALERIVAGRRAIHDETCIEKDRFPCRGCPTLQGVAAALDRLDDSPRDARSVRWILHDEKCASGCQRTGDHADRTQSKEAAALRRFHREAAA